jgi:chromosome segregation ATPase
MKYAQTFESFNSNNELEYSQLFETGVRDIAPGKRIIRAEMMGVPAAKAYVARANDLITNYAKSIEAEKMWKNEYEKEGGEKAKEKIEKLKQQRNAEKESFAAKLANFRKVKKETLENISKELEKNPNKYKTPSSYDVDKRHEEIQSWLQNVSKHFEEEQDEPELEGTPNEEKIKKAEEKIAKLEQDIEAEKKEMEAEEAELAKLGEKFKEKEKAVERKIELEKEGQKLRDEYNKLSQWDQQHEKGKELKDKYAELEKEWKEKNDLHKKHDEEDRDEGKGLGKRDQAAVAVRKRKDKIRVIEDKIEIQKEKIEDLKSGKDPNENKNYGNMKHFKTFESFLNENFAVSTSKYKGAHGKEPRGHGKWAFSVGGEQIFTPNAMNYAEAVKWVKKEAKDRQVHFVEVLP